MLLRSANEEYGRDVLQLEVGDVVVVDGFCERDGEKREAGVQGVDESEKGLSGAFAGDALRRVEDDDERGIGRCVFEGGLKGAFRGIGCDLVEMVGLGPFVGRNHLLVVQNEQGEGGGGDDEQGDGCLRVFRGRVWTRLTCFLGGAGLILSVGGSWFALDWRHFSVSGAKANAPSVTTKTRRRENSAAGVWRQPEFARCVPHAHTWEAQRCS